MKKSLIFASVIAFAAIFAISCEKKESGDAPKARFTYAVDGFDVTFTNASKDATEYAWDFGDGSEISKEENPVHTYAEEGTYAVKLTAKNQFGESSISDNVTIAKKAFVITIDGDFSDWATLPAESVAATEYTDDCVGPEGLLKAEFIADASKIYFYLEFDAEEGLVGPITMVADIDDDMATGYGIWFWNPCGADILIQGSPYPDDDPEWPSAGFQDAGFFKFLSSTEWATEPMEVAEGALAASGVVDVAEGVKAFEGYIVRSAVPGLKSFNVGIYSSDADWSGETGALPSMTADPEEGTQIVPPMLHVNLP